MALTESMGMDLHNPQRSIGLAVSYQRHLSKKYRLHANNIFGTSHAKYAMRFDLTISNCSALKG